MINPISLLNRFYHQLASPREFYRISGYLTPVFGFLSLILFLVGAYLGLVVAPTDYQQGESYRIIYVHVPAAWMSLMIYMTMAIAGAIALIWQMKMAFTVVVCSAPIGAMFTALALATGSIWAKPTWGAWWAWDARLTFELILLFMYFGIIALHQAFDERRIAERATAMMSVVGVVIVPIIHYSVEWWSSLHQGPTVFRTGGSAMPDSMKNPLLIMWASALFYYGYVLFLNARAAVLEQNPNTKWVQSLVASWIEGERREHN
ncbi:MAG: heme ABC transporter permease CcmC [Pseudomonadota bacterium]